MVKSCLIGCGYMSTIFKHYFPWCWVMHICFCCWFYFHVDLYRWTVVLLWKSWKVLSNCFFLLYTTQVNPYHAFVCCFNTTQIRGSWKISYSLLQLWYSRTPQPPKNKIPCPMWINWVVTYSSCNIAYGLDGWVNKPNHLEDSYPLSPTFNWWVLGMNWKLGH